MSEGGTEAHALPFATTNYETDKDGTLRAVLPSRCLYATGEQTCVIFVDHYRERKSGPCYPERAERLRAGAWHDARLVRPVDLAGGRVLVLGLGRIGRLLVSRLRAMEMEVLVHDPFVAEADIAATGAVAAADWRAVLPEIDILTVNCPKTSETTGMVGAAELAAMKATAFVVNTARGGIIDEAALYEALRDHSIGGAGIDAFDQEPAAPDNPCSRWTTPSSRRTLPG